jgi:hypothetical protein
MLIRALLTLIVLTLSIQSAKSEGSISVQRYKDRVGELVIEDFMIPSEDLSIKLYVRNKRHGQMRQFNGNPPLEPRGLEVEFFPKEEVLHEKVKIYG